MWSAGYLPSCMLGTVFLLGDTIQTQLSKIRSLPWKELTVPLEIRADIKESVMREENRGTRDGSGGRW